jgi:hypothetical protein
MLILVRGMSGGGAGRGIVVRGCRTGCSRCVGGGGAGRGLGGAFTGTEGAGRGIDSALTGTEGEGRGWGGADTTGTEGEGRGWGGADTTGTACGRLLMITTEPGETDRSEERSAVDVPALLWND